MRVLTRALLLLSLASGAAAQHVPSISDRSLGPQKFAANPLVAEGDRMYSRRQEGRVGSKASPGPINQAILAYEEAARDPDFVEARWKLVRALYFKGAYTGLDHDSRRAVFQKAKRVAEESIGILQKSLEKRGIKGFLEFGPNVLAGHFQDRSDAAPTFFWAAVAWGEWSLAEGKLDAARAGAAETIRDYALTVIGIDPLFEEGGGYRVLGRLHDQAPSIPSVTDWVSRDEAVKALRLAMQQHERNFANRHFLAEALYRGNAGEKTEAIALEEALVADAPSPQHLIEEVKTQDDARRNLAAWKKVA